VSLPKTKLLKALEGAKNQIEQGWVRGHWIKKGTKTWDPDGEYAYNDDGDFENTRSSVRSVPSETPMRDLIQPELVGANTCTTCLEGALYLTAAREGLTVGDAQDLLALVEAQVPEENGSCIIEFNDDVARNRRDVVNVLDETIKEVKKK
jgi:hypothetical protein